MVGDKKKAILEKVLKDTKNMDSGGKQNYYWSDISLKDLELIINDIPEEEQVWAYSGLSLKRPLSREEYNKYISLFRELLKKKKVPEPDFMKKMGILSVFFIGITAFLTIIGRKTSSLYK